MALHNEPDADTEPMGRKASTPPGEEFGRYKTLRLLGEGGMGLVYLAEQQQPIRRLVALKVIKLGLDTQAVINRFESERQALALMDHPNIARVFDAGSSGDGRPYFVMEYVAGVPLTLYCDQNRLDNRQRLQLFIPVCQAIQHAHQKGIIHRDINPSNVLVSVQDAQPTPKVIDFGVAKATNQRLVERTLFTEHGLLIGTPEYMSPEQIGGEEVDATTDIYSLGTLLYELLVGVLPFDVKMLRGAGYDEIKRIIREEETPRPAVRLHSLGVRTAEIATQRNTDPRTLEKQLRGDLDWITTKAMEKERIRRYASASELAADIERHLRDEPVLASPPGVVYRVRKLVRKRRGVFAAILIALLCLAVGTGLSSFVLFTDEIQRQFETTLEHNISLTTIASDMVKQPLIHPPTRPLREVLRDPGLRTNLSHIVQISHSIVEIAVVDAHTSEILADSVPDRIGTISDIYPDFRQLVKSSSRYDLWRVLRKRRGPNYQVEVGLGTGNQTILYVRTIIAPALLQYDFVQAMERDTMVTSLLALSVLCAACFAFLLTLTLLISRK
jgi:serine/threonine protein kinase